MKDAVQRIVVSGLGGQGVLFITKILADAALEMDRRVLASETHGMAQRGGNVISHLKVGPKNGTEWVAGPLIQPGRADIILALHPESMGAHGHFLAGVGEAFCNNTGGSSSRIHAIDATGTAASLGSPVSANLVLLGYAAASGRLFCGYENVESTLRRYAGKRAEASMNALRAGRGLFNFD